MDLTGRHFLKLLDYTPEEINYLIDLAAELKRLKKAGIPVDTLRGKNVALIFEKTSTRTRSSFEVAAHDLGMGCTYLDPSSSQIGKKESIRDTARVLGRMFEGIEGYKNTSGVETFSKRELEKLLDANGYHNYRFYYPYPDYKFATTIYSDSYLPKKGELRNNRRNFDAERLLLFDEGLAFDTMISAELFPLFSNSFFVEIHKKEEKNA